MRKTLGCLPIVPIAPKISLTAVFTYWVQCGLDSQTLSVLDEIELKESKDEGGNAKFKWIPLDTLEIQDLLKQGCQVTKLALEYDESMQFKLDATFILKNIKYLAHFRDQVDSEDDPKLHWQAEHYLMVDYHRRAFRTLFDLCSQH